MAQSLAHQWQAVFWQVVHWACKDREHKCDRKRSQHRGRISDRTQQLQQQIEVREALLEKLGGIDNVLLYF